MASINTNQRRLIASGSLGDFASGSFTQADLRSSNALPGIFMVISKYADAIEQALRDNLEATGKIASHALYQSIQANVYEVGDTKVVMELQMDDHYKYVNDGRVGKKSRGGVDKKRLVDPVKRGPKLPPFEPISKWVRYKNIKNLSYPGLGFRTRQTSRVSDKLKKARLVDKIRWGIFNKGIEPTYFFTDVINPTLMKQISEDIVSGTGKFLQLSIVTL